MPNLDPWMNQQSEEEFPKPTKFENHLLSIRDEHEKRIGPKHHPTYNERHEEIIKLIDWTLEKYRASIKEILKHRESLNTD
jgi:hypothetical protein